MAGKVRVRAAGIPVLELESALVLPCLASRRRLRRRWQRTAPARSCWAVPGWRILPLRCSREFGVPVIDGVGAAVKQAEALVSLDLETSKRGAAFQPKGLSRIPFSISRTQIAS